MSTMAIKNTGRATGRTNSWMDTRSLPGGEKRGAKGLEGWDLHWRRGTTRATTAAHPWGLFNPLVLAALRRREDSGEGATTLLSSVVK